MRLAKTFLVLTLTAFGSFATTTTPSTVVVPNNDATSGGNNSLKLSSLSGSMELQELLGKGQLPLPAIQITGLSFRAAIGSGPIKATIGSLSVSLSSSPNYPNTNAAGNILMSSTFANNVGPDKTLVYSGSNVTWSDSGCSGPGPCPFDINIAFSTPFTWTGSGTLLIDMSLSNVSVTSGALDVSSTVAPGDGVAQVLGPTGAAAGTFAYQGNVVQLTYATIAGYPSFTGIVNAGSELPSGLPNSGLAQGALIDIYGTNLSAAPPAGQPYTLASIPLPTTAGLAGTTVTITVNGTTVNAPILFALPTQVGLVVPSNTPIGVGSLNLTYNGKTISAVVQIVQSSFGASFLYIQFANNGVGMGEQAAVTFLSGQSVTNTNTAKPGDILTIWGTGLGGTTVAGDSQGAPAGNVGSMPQVFVGGVASTNVIYWGRSPGSVALDQISFTVPTTAPLGCNVSVVVETMNSGSPVVSNAPTISLGSADGATCSDVTTPFPLSLNTRTSTKVFYVGVQQQTQVTNLGGGKTASNVTSGAAGIFFSATQSQLAAFAASTQQGTNYQPSFGSCYSGFNSNPSANGGGLGNVTLLNIGSTLTLTPPSGPAIALTQSGGTYGSASLTNALPSGTWTFSNGTGGAGSGPLTFSFPVPQQVVWTNQTALTNSQVVRANALTITWTGGDANGYVDIQVYGQDGIYDVGLECAAPTSAGQFTVPASMMLGLPSGGGGIQVTTFSIPSSIGNVAGFDYALDASQFQTSIPVQLQ